MIFPRFTGGTLASLAADRSSWDDGDGEGRKPLLGAPSFLAQLGRAVAFLVRRGISHRDIKPDNLGVDGGGRLVISDFGSTLDLSVDVPGPFEVGSPGFHSPEALYAGANHKFVDLFVCGCVVGFALGGHSPFASKPVGSSSPAITFSAVNNERPAYRHQQAGNLSRVLGPPTPADVAALASNLPSLGSNPDGGAKAQEKTVAEIFAGRGETEEERSVYVNAMAGLLRYAPAFRIPAWSLVLRFLRLMSTEERKRLFGDLDGEEKEGIRGDLTQAEAEELFSLL